MMTLQIFGLLLIFAVAWIWGVRCIFSSGHILECVGDRIENYLPKWLYKPTIGCAACMSSIHGTIWFWVVGVHLLPISGLVLTTFVWFAFMICLCGINFILLEAIYKEE